MRVRMSGSVSASTQASYRRTSISPLMAFWRSGRFSVTMSEWPSRSVRRAGMTVEARGKRERVLLVAIGRVREFDRPTRACRLVPPGDEFECTAGIGEGDGQVAPTGDRG